VRDRGDLLRLRFGGVVDLIAIGINVRCLLESALDIAVVMVGALFFYSTFIYKFSLGDLGRLCNVA